MFLPLSDAPNPRGTPVVTYLLLAVNVAAFVVFNVPLGLQRPAANDPLLYEYIEVVGKRLPPGVPARALLDQISAFDLFVFRHGFRPADPSLADLFASMFLHSGVLHLFGNMLFLWIYGDNVEYRLGRLPYLLAYLGTGAFATLFFTLFAAGAEVPLIGASGAISGILGFYFLWFPRNTVRVWIFLFPFFMDVVEISARIVLGVYLVLENLLPFLITGASGGGGVAHGAHIGGFLAGLGAAWGLDRTQLAGRWRRRPPRESAHEDPGEALTGALAEGRHAAAAESYLSLPAPATRRLLSPEDMLALGEWLAKNGDPESALVVFRRHLRDYPNGPGAAEAHLGAGLVQLYALGQVAPAYQHLLDALDHQPAPATAQRAREALREIALRQKLTRR